MAITAAKSAVKIPARPIATVITPMGKAPAPAAPVVAPAAEVAGTTEESEDDADAKQPRMTRKDFATHEEFCDYKIGLAKQNVVKWTERVALWEQKKVNKDADVLVKKAKKADKLIETWIQTQRDMGTPQEEIDAMVKGFKQMAETEAAS